jgi:AraC-like DNA-binding protein
LEFEETTEILSIPIPKKVLGRFHAKPEELAFKKAEQSLAINNILFSYLKTLWLSRSMESIDGHGKRLLASFFDLLVLGFGDAGGINVNISSTQRGHLERCKAYIEKNLVKERLSPSLIAQDLMISERYVFSIFANAGLTVSGYIMSLRLDKAAQMLRSQRFEKQTIATIAFDSGFKSAAHFSRAFKSRFNESPTTYRKRTYL